MRAIGDPDARFREDHLRLLRAVRFAARLGFAIEPATFEAIRAHHALIRSVSAERVRDELVRILTEGGARRGFELLDATGLLADLLPEVAAMKGVEQPPEFHPEGDVWAHTLLLLEKLDHPTPRWRWARCCTTWASRPRSAWPTASASTATWRRACELAARHSRRACVSRATRSSRWRRWWPTTCASRTCGRMKESTLKRFLRLPRFRRAPGAAPPGLPGEPRPAWKTTNWSKRKLEEFSDGAAEAARRW